MPGSGRPGEARQEAVGVIDGGVWPVRPTCGLDWAERASLPVAQLEDTATVRLALAACARNLTGKPAAGSTQRRKRSVFYNALG